MGGSVPEIIEEARVDGRTVLDLSDLYLWELPDSIGQVKRVRTLILSGTKIKSLPRSLAELTELRTLIVAGTKLKTMPDVIAAMPQLEHLDLSRNQLSELPETIGRLSHLERLNLSGNQLSMLPAAIGTLQRLKWLSVIDNRLTLLPEALTHLPQLAELYLHGNDALGVPPEVLGPTSEQVLTTRAAPSSPLDVLEYHLRLKGGSRPLNEAKIILVGRGAVGKTSLVNQLLAGTFNASEGKTDGIKISHWNIRLNRTERVRLNLWDFGGQEIMHATHQFFLTQRSIYLLVLNGREGREDVDAEYWLKLIESFGGESPVIVVLNKIREQPFDLNRRALQQKYPAIREFVRTDCSDATGIPDLHKAIERETDRLDHLRDKFPSSWFAIKERLSETKRNYLTFDEYRGFCANYGEADKSAQGSLAGYLHNLGIALNYTDDTRLRDTHVLNPHWVTNGIYKVLNGEMLQRQNGALSLSDVADILDEAEYPRSMHRFLVDLMKKFDLCFSFPEDDTRFLIPELLHKEEPDGVAAFQPDHCLNFEYHYSVLPEGLLPRFIVRTHARSNRQPRWRTGVILEFEDCRALVRGDVQERRVSISVTGPPANRRRLLAIVRSYFEEIHHHIPRLQPKEMVPVPGHPNAIVAYEKLLAMERKGIQSFPEFVDDTVVDLNVVELLNGIDLQGTRREPSTRPTAPGTVKVFCSYSHNDESFRDELQMHLKLLQRQGLVDLWHDRRIEPGDAWKDQIDDHLERADIIVLLVSVAFVNSNYCYDIEMTRALERHAAGAARVIPVIIRDVNWTRAPFAGLQALPRGGNPVSLWSDRDSAWRSVSDDIEKIVEQIRSRTTSGAASA